MCCCIVLYGCLGGGWWFCSRRFIDWPWRCFGEATFEFCVWFWVGTVQRRAVWRLCTTAVEWFRRWFLLVWDVMEKLWIESTTLCVVFLHCYWFWIILHYVFINHLQLVKGVLNGSLFVTYSFSNIVPELPSSRGEELQTKCLLELCGLKVILH